MAGRRLPNAVGAIKTMTASTASLAAIRSRTARNAVVDTAAVVSTGLLTLAAAARTSRRSAWTSAGRGATVRPTSAQASAANTPAPPALLTIATESPRGGGGG